MKLNLIFVFVLMSLCWLVSCSDNNKQSELKAQSNNIRLEQAEPKKLNTFQYPPISNQFSGGFIPVLVSKDPLLMSKVDKVFEIGFADKTGKLVSQTQKVRGILGNKLSDGLLIVVTDTGRSAFLDVTGQINIIQPDLSSNLSNDERNTFLSYMRGGTDNISVFSEGLARVKIGKRYGFINKKGEIAIEPQFEGVALFSEGLAQVSRDGKAGFINHNGEIEIPAQFFKATGQRQPYTDSSSFSNGRAAMLSKDEKLGTGYIDSTGKWAIEPNFDYVALSFSEGLAKVSKNNKTGYINMKGEWVIKPQFSYGRSFSEGLALVRDSSGVKLGYIDATGKVVIPFQFSYAESFSEGIALAQAEDRGRWGFIDASGKWLAEPQFNSGENFILKGFKEGVAIIPCKVKDKIEMFLLSRTDLITKADPKYKWCG